MSETSVPNSTRYVAKSLLLFAILAVVGFLAGAGGLDLARRWMRPAPVVEGDYSRYFEQTNATVILFGTSTCPYCTKAREFLAERHVDYRDLVIDKSDQSRQLFESLGEQAVPVLLVGTTLIRGFNGAEYDKALTGARASDRTVPQAAE
jgi:glutaredoxin